MFIAEKGNSKAVLIKQSYDCLESLSETLKENIALPLHVFFSMLSI